MDAAPDASAFHACDPVDPVCAIGLKCTSVDTATVPVVACVPAGSAALGSACTFGPQGDSGYDDCVAGAYCLNMTCAQICSLRGGGPTCASGTCMMAGSAFGDPPLAGVCQ